MDKDTDNIFAYDVFGKDLSVDTVNPLGLSADPFGFTRYQADDITDLYYAQARYYNPNTGRFNAEDIIKDGNNWYDYCINNPVSFRDPLGLYCEEQPKIGSFGSINDSISDIERAVRYINMANIMGLEAPAGQVETLMRFILEDIEISQEFDFESILKSYIRNPSNIWDISLTSVNTIVNSVHIYSQFFTISAHSTGYPYPQPKSKVF